jgi:hypothetical protein
MNRTDFAERIASGLAGWFQEIAAQNLASQVSEDAARMELVRMISALRSFVPDTSQRPTNWPTNTKKRLDIGVLGRKATATGWYGAIELKWPGLSIDVSDTRQRIVEDAVRVAFAKTSNLCANFVVLGGTTEAITAIFDTSHTQGTPTEQQRLAFKGLFSRNPASPAGFLTNTELNARFPDFGDRVPQTVFNGWSRRLRTELVTYVEAKIGAATVGSVYVWQCKK